MADISTITLPDGSVYSFKDSAARTALNTYSANFATTDWSGSGPYTLSVTAATHGCGTTPLVQVLRASGSAYQTTEGYPTVGFTMSVDGSGNITVTTTTAFAGRIVVR